VAQTLFQGSSSKGKAPVSALKFRAPTASAPPPPNVVQEAGPGAHYTAPSAPGAQYTALPAPSVSYAAPPALSAYYAPPPQYQYVRQDPAVPMPSAVAPPANPPMSKDEITAHVEEVLSRSTVASKPRSVADYCKLPPVYFPSGFKAPKYRKYNGTSDPNLH